jgi:hypothetical protein
MGSFFPGAFMYCPKCSQQQVSDEVRFCSRCGFPLGAVRELIASGGALADREAGAQAGQLSRTLRGVRKGVCIMLASLPLALVAGLLTAINDAFAILILLPVLCFVAGFARLLYGTFKEEKGPRVKTEASPSHVGSVMPAQLGAAERNPQLRPARVGPIEDFTARRLVTGEMAQPPSVTEKTTRLLDEEADSMRE